MASPAEDKTGSSTTPFIRDVESAGANVKEDAETTAGRVAEDQIAQSVAAARDDPAGDLRKLKEDVAKIKDAVAEIARIVGSQIGEPATQLGSEIASTVKEKLVITMVFALVGAILLLLALVFGIEALHEWLKSRYGSLPAFVILCAAWAVPGIVFLCVALLLSKRSRRAGAAAGVNLQHPSADRTKLAVHRRECHHETSQE
jgi:hypothetical protein